MKTVMIKQLIIFCSIVFSFQLYAEETKINTMSISGTVKVIEKDYVEIEKDGKTMKLPRSAFDKKQALKVGKKATGKVQVNL